MKKLLLILIFYLTFIQVNAQSIEEIKADNSIYLWGEGSGNTLNRADKEALSMLISQIYTHVESSFSLLKESLTKNGKDEKFSQNFQSVVNTYSEATLKNTERIVLENEPDAKVFRYIKRAELARVFQGRKEKILGFTKNAETSIVANKIADGLRYYYWALTLLKSHPDGSEIEYVDKTGQKQLLASWIPMQINNIFSGIDICVSGIESEEKYSVYTLNIRHNNLPVENFDYSYWDGSDWSNLVSARNGLGIIELYGVAVNTEKLQLKAEYLFEGEARIDHELEDVLSKIDPIPFRNSYYNVSLKKTEHTDMLKSQVAKDVEYVHLTQVADISSYQKSIENIMTSIRLKKYDACEKEFTTEGYQVFKSLIQYGNARIIGTPELRFISFDDKVICRSIPMSFNFATNNKQFIENVVIHFNKRGKVENLAFSLSQIALEDVLNKVVWKEHERMILVNFLEFYKTAYALKRIDYIEKIFDDDALIITGSVVKVKPNEMNNFLGNAIVRYNRQTKQEYIKNLRYSFNSKEYVNIKFEESTISKAGKGGEIYGIQVKQNYFSSNYGDVGYLFLILDLNNTDEPIIHVRTWQPEVGLKDSIYGLSDFN